MNRGIPGLSKNMIHIPVNIVCNMPMVIRNGSRLGIYLLNNNIIIIINIHHPQQRNLPATNPWNIPLRHHSTIAPPILLWTATTHPRSYQNNYLRIETTLRIMRMMRMMTMRMRLGTVHHCYYLHRNCHPRNRHHRIPISLHHHQHRRRHP